MISKVTGEPKKAPRLRTYSSAGTARGVNKLHNRVASSSVISALPDSSGIIPVWKPQKNGMIVGFTRIYWVLKCTASGRRSVWLAFCELTICKWCLVGLHSRDITLITKWSHGQFYCRFRYSTVHPYLYPLHFSDTSMLFLTRPIFVLPLT